MTMIESILLDCVVETSKREAAIDALGLSPEDPNDPYAASTEEFVELARDFSVSNRETIPAPPSDAPSSGVDFAPGDPHADEQASDDQSLPLRWPPRPCSKEVAF